jgi:hypothetical protein
MKGADQLESMITRIVDARLSAVVMDVAVLGTLSTRRDEVITGLTQTVSNMNTRLDTAMSQADSLRMEFSAALSGFAQLTNERHAEMAQKSDQQHAQLVALIMHQNQGFQGGGGLPGGAHQHHG